MIKKRVSVFFKITSILVLLALFPGCATGGKGVEIPEEVETEVFIGEIDLGTVKLDIVLHLVLKPELSGSLDITTQRAYRLPITDLVYSNGELSFTLAIKPVPAYFKGTLEGDHYAGTFLQGQARGVFTLYPGEKPAEEPEAEEGEEVSLVIASGKLSGTLLLPEGRGPFPVAIIIAGSGPTDRNGNSPLLPGRNDSLKMLAEALKGLGVASLRYDKRGIGKSAASLQREEDLRFDHLIDDAAAWSGELKKRDNLSSVIIIGHSEGALIGLEALNKAGAAGYISLAGMGRRGDILLKEQLREVPEPDRSKIFTILDSLSQGKLVQEVPEEYFALLRPSVQPYLVSWLSRDPEELISRTSVPVLIIQGTTDLQVTVEDAERLHRANPSSKLVVIEGMNHVLKDAPLDQKANLEAYSNPELPLSGELIRVLETYFREHFLN